ncbi:hypothetical protein Ocin01_17901 [Orchesella cincta]|uniref:Uncharacterized protein n=1 Tax=Orchesella cincta TaxID=48709 RepID=A0A1D2M778_ORCCI|nr:hypothetical protein Ocin01_17901 [Orchesella cincta]
MDFFPRVNLISKIKFLGERGSWGVITLGERVVEGKRFGGKVPWGEWSSGGTFVGGKGPWGTQHNGGWIPGKAGIVDDGVFRCQIQHWQVGYNSTDFEANVFLVWPAETTSWVETKGSNIPNRPIVAGMDPGDGETTYVCLKDLA